VLVGAGKLGGAEQHGTEEHGVFLAIGGCQRLWKAPPPEDPALQRYTDVTRIPRDVKWAALNGLQELHDAGVLHGCANSRSLFVQPNHVSAILLSCKLPCCLSCIWPVSGAAVASIVLHQHTYNR
jgi:hypothetical protein